MGGESFVRSIWQRLKAENTPIAALWIQDWQGSRFTPLGIRMWWNWELDEGLYPDWRKLVQDLAREGIAALGYINPFLSDATSKGNVKRNLFIEARDKGYLVARPDGSPYEIDSGGFTGTLVDLTNPAAFDWYKKVIISSILRLGMKGWMADFGEALPFDAKLHEGSGLVVHKLYPELWARVNREAIREAGLEGEAVGFLRSASLRSSRYASLYWLGDQMTTWDEHDGMKSAITGLLSSGLSGMSVNHMDIGGLISLRRSLGSWTIINFSRSKELLQRSAELSAFTAIYRNHEGNNPDRNHQFYSDDETLAFFAKFAKVFALLTD
jgi:alpha-glucosidase